MTAGADLLADAFGRINEGTVSVVEGLSPADLSRRVAPGANTIGWLVWHLVRVQDNHVAEAAGTEEVWTSDGWYQRFNLPFSEQATGYGHSRDDVDTVHVTAELLTGYARAVGEVTLNYVRGLSDADLERVVDSSWDPPVTLAVRLVSVIADDLKHLGQAEYVRGLL
ncbi:DUF664 domain-containing protein [Aeromicrobium sp. NPDC092404]|uniref:mycothiol transferase n=1 Tax=Aeromicrobium sp. NPDC092404 TaxID=3154976 RepID=UPI003443F63F